MPRFFFDLHDDVDAIDEEGSDFPDLAAAKANALKEAREMIQTSVETTGRIDLRHYIDIRDESGTVVSVLHFQDAVTVHRGSQLLSEPRSGI